MAKVEVKDRYDDALVIDKPATVAPPPNYDGVIRICIEDDGGPAQTWIGNRAQLRDLIEALEAWEKALPNA